ncbi:MAG TPA: LAGLIDADG family homing endonuclease [Candidatus Nanoarchaeia archaeon]|nr:LAGLIDADG family homing endonuclease [Candidatus Nanoarchaeia archaeon]
MVVVTQEIKDMLKVDIPVYEISRKTSIYPSTLHYHYKKLYGLKLKKVNINFPSQEEIGEFMGIFAGDGSFYHDRKRGHYNIRVCTGYYETDYAQVLFDNFSKWFSKEPYVYYIQKDEDLSAIITGYSSKEIYLFIKEYLVWEGKKSYSVRLKSLADKKLNLGFLRGLIDTDGNFHRPKNCLSFSTVSPKLATQVLLIIKQLFNIEASLYIAQEEGKADLYRISLYSKNAKNILEKIKPNNFNKTLSYYGCS